MRKDARTVAWPVLFLSLALLTCGGCGPPADRTEADPAFEPRSLAEIMKSGELRILLPKRDSISRLPRSGNVLDFEPELAEAYARKMKLEPVRIIVESRDRLIPDLLAGRGDLIAANLTATAERKKSVVFTVPVAVVREQLVARLDDEPIAGPADLAGRTIAVRRSSSFWETVSKLARRQPGLEIEEVEENVDTEEIIHRVTLGEYDLTVADSNLVEACLEYRDDIGAAFDLTRDRPIAMAVRPEATGLLASLNRYLTDSQLTDRKDQHHSEDLSGIKQRRVLRMITRNNMASYFLYRGELMGFEYDLMKEFARQQGLRLEVIVSPNGDELLPWLRDGHGDVVAAALTPTDERRREGAAFTRAYNHVEQLIVRRAGDATLRRREDLAGRSVHVRRHSSYWKTLQDLRDDDIDVKIVIEPEMMETEQIIDRVAAGDYDLTLADSHIVNIELQMRDDIEIAFSLTEQVPLAWAVRKSNPELLQALNEFLDREYRGLLYNIIYTKYFKDSRRIAHHRSQRPEVLGALSPYDDKVQKYAAQYDFDWRLILAVMFQESRFNPGASSFAGAQGLMQVLPGTAGELGFENLYDPEEAIHAGVKYLAWVRDRFEPELSVKDRMWFALAAYNAGAGHVRDARRLARQQGWNPNVWFGNVERAMLLLSRPQYAQTARHGYCRCGEPVRYVRDVRSRYNAYVSMNLGDRPSPEGQEGDLHPPRDERPRPGDAG